MKYTLAELHIHTSEVSGCAKITAEEVTQIFKNNGYDLIVITNHFCRGTFWRYYELGLSWKDTVDEYLSAYRKAKALGDTIGIKVLFGIEITFDESPNDYLVYGITENFLYEHPELYSMSTAEFSQLARNEGFFFAQAHPHRNENNIKPIDDPSLLDGCEAYNFADNDIPESYMWAKENCLIIIGGQDYHRYDNMRGLKTAFYGKVENMKTLTEKLFSKEFDLIITPN